MSKSANNKEGAGGKKEDTIKLDLTKIYNIFSGNNTKYIYLIAAFLIGLLAYYIRALPQIEFLQAIDPYYIYRMTNTLLHNNFILPKIDYLRYYPTGFPPLRDYYVLFYAYGVIYSLLFKPFSISFLKFAQYIPPILSIFYAVILYLITIEIFGKNHRIIGLFSAFSFAVLNATIFRSSKGFFEKEPIAGFFILLSFLFFIKAQKRGKIEDSILAGIFTSLAYSLWGGSVMLIYLYAAYIFSIIFLGKSTKKEETAYIIYGISYLIIRKLLYFNRSIFRDTLHEMLILSIIGVGFLLGLEYYFHWDESKKRKYFPTIILSGGVFSLILGFFIPSISKILFNIKHLILYKKQVIESTVAENVEANLSYFLNSFGIRVSFNNSIINYLLSPWFFGVIAVYVIIIKKIKDNYMKYVAILSHTFAVVSYYSFIKASGNNALANILYVVFVIITILILLWENLKIESLLLLFNYATFLMFVTKVRIAYPTGLFFSILAGYGMGILFMWTYRNVGSLFPNELNTKIILKAISVFVISIYLIMTFYYNISYAKKVGLSLTNTEKNELWDEALNFLKTNTSTNAVILSWWDFGYWFQTIGERKTLLDGGNQGAYRNVFAAKYFTGRYNKTWDLLYLEVFHPTHILVDYTMIGKYAAMSKIANNGKWIDSYVQLRLQKNQGNYLIYTMPYYKVYVPLTTNGTFDITKDIILLPQDMNPLYLDQAPLIKYLCTPKGIIDLSFFKPNSTSRYIKECLYILPGYPQIAYLTMTHRNNKVGNKIYESNFHKLYVEDGQRIPYVKKVFDNFYVKIYSLNYTYIENELRKENITQEYINKVKDACLDSYKTTNLKQCPLYYDKIDYEN